jgi:hypothetical protein
MSGNVPAVTVELSTPRGEYFAWTCSAVELRTVDGTIEINPAIGSLLKVTEITLRRRAEFYSYVLENATANLKDGRLILLAEQIRQVEPVQPASDS